MQLGEQLPYAIRDLYIQTLCGKKHPSLTSSDHYSIEVVWFLENSVYSSPGRTIEPNKVPGKISSVIVRTIGFALFIENGSK